MATRPSFPAWARFSGIGLELGGAIAGLVLAGYWVDGKYGTSPWGAVIGAGIGIVGGLYNLVKQAQAASREAAQSDAADTGGQEHGASLPDDEAEQ